jgi:uncharacterized protein with von Willebrand factor type A (vWA) domain
MFVDFLYQLRRHRVPVGAQEAVALARALEVGLHDSALDGFYEVARALCVHGVAQLDAFDQAFLAHFKGIESQGQQLAEELLQWLRDASEKPPRERSPEESAALEALDSAALQALFERRMREQRQRHEGGDRWIGTRGTSPFGNAARQAAEGFRIEGTGGGRSALKTADARLYRGYRDDQVLDTRAMGMALRKLRAFTREGAPDELDLDGTIDATARNAGSWRWCSVPAPSRHPGAAPPLDVGGSMTPTPTWWTGSSAPPSQATTSGSCGPTTSTTASTGGCTGPSALDPLPVSRSSPTAAPTGSWWWSAMR